MTSQPHCDTNIGTARTILRTRYLPITSGTQHSDLCYCSEVRADKPSLRLNLGTNGLKVTSEPPQMAGQAGCLQGQDRSAVTHPSSSHARRCFDLVILP
ncbi:hypothetical protein J6590_101911 [Homalodisca vitripennis]|nr:hypothetical protein J6590_101911 [Homalodisca vitripennis]